MSDNWMPPPPRGMPPFPPKKPAGVKARMTITLKADDVVVCEVEDSALWARVMAAMLTDLNYPLHQGATEPTNG